MELMLGQLGTLSAVMPRRWIGEHVLSQESIDEPWASLTANSTGQQMVRWVLLGVGWRSWWVTRDSNVWW